MSSENHLTVRDYFDRVMGTGPRSKKALSSGKIKSSAARGFHQILTARQTQASTKPQAKSGGLKITDYLARPVRTQHKFKIKAATPPSENNSVNTDRLSGAPPLPKARESAKITSAPSQAKIIKDIPNRHHSIARLSHEQTSIHEQNKIEKSISKAAQKYDLPVKLIKGVIRAESNFQVKAVSQAGAQGLMQLMPATARDLGVKNPFNIEENIDGGARYLRKMLDSFGGDLKLALAAYNAGPEAVIKYGGKVPPYLETQQYVQRVLRFTRQMA
jgi:soluble lytic murein transglycosylase-like protein